MIKSIKLLQDYLTANQVNINVENYIKPINIDGNFNNSLSIELFDCIIVDAYEGFAEDVKDISTIIKREYGIYLGRIDKIAIKTILDYGQTANVKLTRNLINDKFDIKKILSDHRMANYYKIVKNREIYFKKLKQAIENINKDRIKDYLNFLYSRIIYFNEYRKRSIYDIFQENKFLIQKEFSIEIYNNFKKICESCKELYDYKEAIAKYNKLYTHKLLNYNIKLYDLVYININQSLYDNFSNKKLFYSYMFTLINLSYNKIKNHRTLVIKIDNIIDKNINIKWGIYSFLTIYSENFILYEEKNNYYKPEQIATEFLEHKYEISTINNFEKYFKLYFENKMEFDRLNELLENKLNQQELDTFKKINTGFHFIDCIILSSKMKYPNTEEINFIDNQNTLLLIFEKHAIDKRKIPCPVCGSIKISGNSYTEIGLKSWECKNETCCERSKTNRGKRYSNKSNDMQSGVYEEIEENLIDKQLIAKWRKDLVNGESLDTLYEMLIRYFSFSGSNVLFLKNNEDNYIYPEFLNASRNIEKINIEEYLKFDSINLNILKDYKESGIFKKFIYRKNKENNEKNTNIGDLTDYKIINVNCINYLNSLKNDSFDHMVTSPPYYNAREYSQWKNLYNYLNDMYNLSLEAYRALKTGGIFFYNIADIFDNPNTIVKSTMGQKRIALGAYIVLIFKYAGFELLDNIIWDKGETQSNRHKNDGNYTPYYQRPANCYEHIFIFKKPGKPIHINNHYLNTNIIKFPPVIKINSKGENIYGHTAPYPLDLPKYSILTFTKEGDIIFDPFLGSGTTIIAALQNKRRGLGTELDLEYYRLAKKQIEIKIRVKDQLLLQF